MVSPGSDYQQRIESFQQQRERFGKRLRTIPWSRLLMFLLTGFFIYQSFQSPGPIFIIASILSFAGFLVAGYYDNHLKKEISRFGNLLEINHREVRALGGDHSGSDPGKGFINQDHPYTHDLDIFGDGSLFQCVNRTSTIFGSERLADYFIRAFQYRNEILPRQKAIRELAGNIGFRQHLQLIFTDQKTSRGDLVALQSWLDKGSSKNRMNFLAVLSYAMPGIMLCSLILSIIGIVPYQFPLLLILLQLFIVFGYARKTLAVHQTISSQVDILHKYSLALSLTGETVFHDGFIIKLQNELKYHEMPGKVIRRLSGLLNWMDSNLNLLVSVILNGLIMFNIHLLVAVERWRITYRKQVPVWFSVLAEFDALSSLGTFSFNHPDYIFPEPVTHGFAFMATDIGHPLIPAGTCVTNNIEIRGWDQFCIITGANMSGKSTFLRTVGVNYLLAMIGAPVFASNLIFYPIELHSSIRTNDSLAKRESYFYAELRRLKEIIDELEQGKEKLILLDEILKGTNSSDKQTGSIALIRQLMKYKLVGMFATHDLALGNLISHYPDQIQNLCFEIQITDDRMEIDYKLIPGVCRNLNASYLMKNMGIILDDKATEKA